MKEEVLISVKSTQIFDGMAADSIELITPGHMADKNGGYEITYLETDPDTSAETFTTVTTTPDGMISVVREGEIGGEMIFEQGRKHVFHYDTSEGSMTMGISASKVGVALNEAGGLIDIEYAIEIENALAYENQFHMHITRPGQNRSGGRLPS